MRVAAREVPAGEFFQVGGTLSADAPSYVERKADEALLAAIERRELCLVLAPRQTGKSSLMVHAMARLRKQGRRVGIVDLQPLGSIADPEQWFSDVLYQIERSLKLDTDSTDWWDEHCALGPTQRFLAFLEDVVLREAGDKDVALFFDEVDSVLPLPFSDDFFTTIRSLYNARAHNPALSRLTFVLLGVATPSSFIRDRSRTPFNIGVSIPLEDFDRAAIEPFRRVLGTGCDSVIDRIFHWTSGQPLLVQRLAALAYGWKPEERTGERIDAEVQRSYLERKVEQDTHLKFIRDYLLDKTSNVRETLGLYRDVLESKSVAEDQQSTAQTRLRLAGVVRGENGRLVPRNRIYESIFDRDWVRENIVSTEIFGPLHRWLESGRKDDYVLTGPALEEARAWAAGRDDITHDERDFIFAGLAVARKKEQARATMQRRFVAALSVLTLLAAILAFLAVRARNQAAGEAEKARQAEGRATGEATKAHQEALRAQQAETQAKNSARNEAAAKRKALESAAAARRAEQQARRAEREAKAAAASERGSMKSEVAARARAERLRAEADRLRKGADRQRGLARSRELASHSIQQLGNDRELSVVLAAAACREGRTEQAEDALRRAMLSLAPLSARTVLTGHGTRNGHLGTVVSASFSPNGKYIVTSSDDRTARVWDVSSGKSLRTLSGHTGSVYNASFSPDGKYIVTASIDNTVRVWDVSSGRSLQILSGRRGYMQSASFSPNGKYIVTSSDDNTARVWDASSGKNLQVLSGHQDTVAGASFSPDSRFIVTASIDGTARVWDASSGKSLRTLSGHTNSVYNASFSPNGKYIVTSSDDRTARVWDASSGKSLRTLSGHTRSVVSASFSPDGKYIVTASYDNTARVWDASSGKNLQVLSGHQDTVYSARFSSDGKYIITASRDRTARVWDASSGKSMQILSGHQDTVVSASFSPDSRFIVTASIDRTARVYRWTGPPSISELLAVARQRVKRPLTADEKKTYSL